MKCPECKEEMKKIKYDVGFGIVVDSLTCSICKHSVTNEEMLNNAMKKMREKMAISVKTIRIGNGIGIRFPNEIAKNMHIKQGQEMEIITKGDELIIRKD
ncbi:MAG: AbrB/MazE/SpoVT family DNA-binding domain-containing protein [Candidatus Aenigmatarchaeota archaeon]